MLAEAAAGGCWRQNIPGRRRNGGKWADMSRQLSAYTVHICTWNFWIYGPSTFFILGTKLIRKKHLLGVQRSFRWLHCALVHLVLLPNLHGSVLRLGRRLGLLALLHTLHGSVLRLGLRLGLLVLLPNHRVNVLQFGLRIAPIALALPDFGYCTLLLVILDACQPREWMVRSGVCFMGSRTRKIYIQALVKKCYDIRTPKDLKPPAATYQVCSYRSHIVLCRMAKTWKSGEAELYVDPKQLWFMHWMSKWMSRQFITFPQHCLERLGQIVGNYSGVCLVLNNQWSMIKFNDLRWFISHFLKVCNAICGAGLFSWSRKHIAHISALWRILQRIGCKTSERLEWKEVRQW